MLGIGGSSTLGIGLVVQLRDQFTQQANNITASLNRLTGSANKALGNSFNLMTKVGTGMVVAGYGITRGFMAATESAMEFQKVLISVKALSGEISDAQMNALGNVAMKLGPKFGMSAIQVAEGMEELVKAGVAVKDIPMILEQMVLTAMGAGEKLGGEQGVAARMTDIMMAFKIAPENVARMGDILSKATVESTINFNSLAESFKYSQDILKGFGFTLEESAAMIAVLGNVGLKGSMAGVSLANAWKELGIAIGGTSKKKNKALQAMGISPQDLTDEFGGMRRPLEIFEKVRKGVAGMGEVERSNVLGDLFGVRGKRAVSPLLEMLVKGPSDKWSGKSLTDMVNSLTLESAGSNMKIFEEKSKSAAFQWERLKANWENFKITMGNAILPMLNRMIPMISSMMEKLAAFGQTNFGKFLSKGIALFGAILIPAGALLTITGLLGKALLSGAGYFASFGKAGAWAFNTLLGRAAAFQAMQMGVGPGMAVNTAGSIYDTKTGRIVSNAATLNQGRFAVATASSTTLLGRFGGVLGGLITGLMPLIGIVAGLYILGETIDVLTTKYQAEDKYRNYLFEAAPGVQYSNIPSKGPESGPILSASDLLKLNQSKTSEIKGQTSTKGDTYINVHVDGKKTITKKINEGTENEANTAYGLNH